MMDKECDQKCWQVWHMTAGRHKTNCAAYEPEPLSKDALEKALVLVGEQLAVKEKQIADQEELNRILALDVNKKELQIEAAVHSADCHMRAYDECAVVIERQAKQIEAMREALGFFKTRFDDELMMLKESGLTPINDRLDILPDIEKKLRIVNEALALDKGAGWLNRQGKLSSEEVKKWPENRLDKGDV